MRVLFFLLCFHFAFAQTTITKPKPNLMKASMLVMKYNPSCKVSYKIPVRTPVRFMADPNAPCMDSVEFYTKLRDIEKKAYE
jgi:hypothetical protein